MIYWDTGLVRRPLMRQDPSLLMLLGHQAGEEWPVASTPIQVFCLGVALAFLATLDG